MGVFNMKFQRLVKEFERFKTMIAIGGLQAAIGIFLISHFDSERSDFRLFYSSAKELLKGQSPWNIATHEYGNAYLNDPITLWLLTPLTTLGYDKALLLFRLINVLIAIVMVNVLIRKNNLVTASLISIFLLTTVALRSNLEYGALGFMAFSLWLVAVKWIQANTNLVLAGVLLAYTSMFKPQLYFINIFVLLFSQLRVKISFALTIITSIIVTSIYVEKFIILDWIEAIKLRAEIAQNDNLQMDIACLLRILGVDPTIATFTYLLVFSTILLILWRKKLIPAITKSPEELLILATTLSVFLHPTDLSIAAYLLAAVYLVHKNLNLIVLLSISLLTVWSNNLFFAGISAIITLVLYKFLARNVNSIRRVAGVAIALIPILFAVCSKVFADYENFLRNALNYVGIFILMIVVLLGRRPSTGLTKLETEKK
jgi:hypothetical protein